MKDYDIWSLDGNQYVSSWNDWSDAQNECDRLNKTLARRYPIGFEVRKNYEK
jgi:hypothetical protein